MKQFNVILLTVYFVLVFYLIGAIAIENEVNYRTWRLVGAAEFPAFHQAFDQLLTPFFKVPFGLCLLIGFLLIFFRPQRDLLGIYIINFIILAYFIAFSLLILVPIHDQLSEMHSTVLIEQLIRYNTSGRVPAVILLVFTNIYLLYKAIKIE
jgi:hypothetical protein